MKLRAAGAGAARPLNQKEASMLRMAPLSVAAFLAVGGLTLVGCQNDEYDRDDSGSAQTSGSVYTGTPSGTDNTSYNGSGSDSVDRNQEPGRGLSSSNLETHGGPSRITGGEDVDHQGIGVTGDMPA